MIAETAIAPQFQIDSAAGSCLAQIMSDQTVSKNARFKSRLRELLAQLKLAIGEAKGAAGAPHGQRGWRDRFALPFRRRQRRFESGTKAFFRRQLELDRLLGASVGNILVEMKRIEGTHVRLCAMLQGVSEQAKAIERQVAATLEKVGQLRPLVNLGDGTILTKTVYGHKIYLPAGDESLSPCIMMEGYWEPHTTNHLGGLVKRGMVVMDIGANVGWYSLLMASWVGPEGKVLCFEANPALAPIIQRSLRGNGLMWASVECCAVMDESRETAFHVLRDAAGGSSLDSGLLEQHGDRADCIRVPGLALDDYVASHPEWQRVDLIRMDVEGAEFLVLKGMRKLIQANPGMKIVLEFGPTMIPSFAGSLESFVDLLGTLGFRRFSILSEAQIRQVTPRELLEFEGRPIVLDVLCEQEGPGFNEEASP